MTDTTLQLILQKLGTIETDMSEMKNEINGIKDEMSGVKNEVNGIKDEMSALKAQLDENTEITKAIHHRQSETDAKLEGMALDFANLQGEQVDTKERLVELEEDQKSTNEVIGEHEISLRTLRRRSV